MFRSFAFLVALLAFVAPDATALVRPAASPVDNGVSGGGLPTIAAGSAQPGSVDGAWINWGPIAQPAQQGSAGQGFTANAIAEWDNVQYEFVSGTVTRCVIGYHVS